MARLTFQGGSGDDAVWYFFVVRGDARDLGENPVDQDVIAWGENHHIVSGFVRGGVDEYEVDTVIMFTLGDGPVTVLLDGTQATPQEVVQRTGGEGLPLPTLTPEECPTPEPGPDPEPPSQFERVVTDPAFLASAGVFVVTEVSRGLGATEAITDIRNR